jgi:hypothetical protein
MLHIRMFTYVSYAWCLILPDDGVFKQKYLEQCIPWDKTFISCKYIWLESREKQTELKGLKHKFIRLYVRMSS